MVITHCKGLPRRWWRQRPCRCIRKDCMWHLVALSGWHHGVGSQVGLAGLLGLFQPNWFFHLGSITPPREEALWFLEKPRWLCAKYSANSSMSPLASKTGPSTTPWSQQEGIDLDVLWLPEIHHIHHQLVQAMFEQTMRGAELLTKLRAKNTSEPLLDNCCLLSSD